MDTARQLLRFTIPGGVLLINGIVSFLLLRRCQGVPYSTSLAFMRQNLATVLAIAATIPVGFLTYQIYYAIYGPTFRLPLRRWRGRFVRLDRGSQVLHHFGESQREALELIFGIKLDFSKPHESARPPKSRLRHPYEWIVAKLHVLELKEEWRALDIETRKRRYQERWYNNWDVLRAVLDIAGSNGSTAQVKSEYVTLSDLYHTLGATRTAVTISWVGLVGIAAARPHQLVQHWIGSLIGLVLATSAAVMLSVFLHLARRRTWMSASSSLRYGLHWLFTQHPELFVTKAKKRKRRTEVEPHDAAPQDDAQSEDWRRRARSMLRTVSKGVSDVTSRVSEFRSDSSGQDDPGGDAEAAQTGGGSDEAAPDDFPRPTAA